MEKTQTRDERKDELERVLAGGAQGTAQYRAATAALAAIYAAEQREAAGALVSLAAHTERTTSSLTWATWVLAWATVGLFITTCVLVYVTARGSG